MTTTLYTTWGSVRSDCGHEHRTMDAAERCLERDQRACRRLGGGAYSDRELREIDRGEIHSYSVLTGPGETVIGEEPAW